MNKVACLLGFSLLPISVSAVSFEVDAETLKDQNGTAMPVTGQVLLVASTGGSSSVNGNTFIVPRSDSPLAAGSFLIGSGGLSDDLVVARVDLDSGFGAGSLSQTLNLSFGLDSTGSWQPGDQLSLYWFPSLSSGSTTPGVGTHLGMFRDDVTDATSRNAWVTPGASSTISLQFVTQDANGPIFPGGVYPSGAAGYPSATGNASQVVTPVPEPSQFAAAFGLGCLAWAFVARKSKRSAAAA
jgi:hypothetical protein